MRDRTIPALPVSTYGIAISTHLQRCRWPAFDIMSIDHLAQDFSALLAAGEARRATEKYWAPNVDCIDPSYIPGGNPERVSGFETARERLNRWLDDNSMDDVMIDGPFITGNKFALFIDMMVTKRATGESAPFSEIAIYTVCEDKIVEERHFYEPAGAGE